MHVYPMYMHVRTTRTYKIYARNISTHKHTRHTHTYAHIQTYIHKVYLTRFAWTRKCKFKKNVTINFYLIFMWEGVELMHKIFKEYNPVNINDKERK